MKRFLKSKKGLALLATLVVAAAAAVGAYAYFTSTGSGVGSATVGTATTWTVGQTATSVAKLYPDGPAANYPAGPWSGNNIATEQYTVTNGGSGSQNLTSVDIKVAENDGTAWYSCTDGTSIADVIANSGLCGDGSTACSAADFSVGGQPAGNDWNDTTLARDFTAGESEHSTVTLEMVDNGDAQDNCQDVTVPLYYYAS